MAYIYAAPLATKLHPPSPCIVHTLSPSIILYTYTPVRPAAGAAAAATQQHGRRFGEAGGGDGGCAGDVRRREHILQAGGVGRHGHEGAGGLPLPLRLRLPGAPRLLHREVRRRCSSGLRLHGRWSSHPIPIHAWLPSLQFIVVAGARPSMHPSIHPGLLVSTFLFKGGKGQKRNGRRRWKLGSSSASRRRPIDPLNFRVFFLSGHFPRSLLV